MLLKEILDFNKPYLSEYIPCDDWSDFSILKKNNIFTMIVYNGKEREPTV